MEAELASMPVVFRAHRHAGQKKFAPFLRSQRISACMPIAGGLIEATTPRLRFPSPDMETPSSPGRFAVPN